MLSCLCFWAANTNAILSDAFGCRVTFPIPKGPEGKCSSLTDDYRGISVNLLLSKIYESCLMKKIENYLISSPHLFGFKAGVGCGHAIYTLHKTIEYYIKNGSSRFSGPC